MKRERERKKRKKERERKKRREEEERGRTTIIVVEMNLIVDVTIERETTMITDDPMVVNMVVARATLASPRTMTWLILTLMKPRVSWKRQRYESFLYDYP